MYPNIFLERRTMGFDKFKGKNYFENRNMSLLPPTSYRFTKIENTMKSP